MEGRAAISRAAYHVFHDNVHLASLKEGAKEVDNLWSVAFVEEVKLTLENAVGFICAIVVHDLLNQDEVGVDVLDLVNTTAFANGQCL